MSSVPLCFFALLLVRSSKTPQALCPLCSLWFIHGEPGFVDQAEHSKNKVNHKRHKAGQNKVNHKGRKGHKEEQSKEEQSKEQRTRNKTQRHRGHRGNAQEKQDHRKVYPFLLNADSGCPGRASAGGGLRASRAP